jgi:cysteine synthase
VGISSAANVLAILAQNILGDQAILVSVLPDSRKKYNTTDRVGEESARDAFLSKHIEFLDTVPIKRSVTFCLFPVA